MPATAQGLPRRKSFTDQSSSAQMTLPVGGTVTPPAIHRASGSNVAAHCGDGQRLHAAPVREREVPHIPRSVINLSVARSGIRISAGRVEWAGAVGDMAVFRRGDACVARPRDRRSCRFPVGRFPRRIFAVFMPPGRVSCDVFPNAVEVGVVANNVVVIIALPNRCPQGCGAIG